MQIAQVLAGLLLLVWATKVGAQDRPRGFSLGDQVWAVLPAGWVEKPKEDVPPPNLLVASAPKLLFQDVLVLENPQTLSVLKIALSENPFFGSAPQLEGRMRGPTGTGSGLLEHLFFLGFPPPRTCLAQAKAELEAAKRRDEEERAKIKEEDRPPPKLITIRRPCEFASTALDFYTEQVSAGLALDSNGRGGGLLRSFYVANMEQAQVAGRTLFIFEAQGQRQADRPDLEKFNLPEAMRGARAHFFWAIGAEEPFPFIRDPLRRNVPLAEVYKI